MDLFFRGSHTTNFVTCGFNRSYNQAADVPSSNVTCKSPRNPSINCRIMLAFVSMTDSITTLPTEFLTAIEILSLCTSIPIYLVLVIKGVLSGRVEPNTQNPTPKGRPFRLRRDPQQTHGEEIRVQWRSRGPTQTRGFLPRGLQVTLI